MQCLGKKTEQCIGYDTNFGKRKSYLYKHILCVCVCLCLCRERMCVYTHIHMCVCMYKTDINLFPLGNKIVLLGARDDFMIYL